jgi:flagellin
MVQTAEAALGEQQDMIQRLRELAVQAANDTYTASDRAAIQAEADQLVSEIDRIATQTSFNGRRLLDGTLSDATFQVGAYENETVSLTVRDSRAANLGAVYEVTGGSEVSSALAAGDLQLNGFDVAASEADSSGAGRDADSAYAIAVAINASSNEHGVSAEANATTVSAAYGSGAAVDFDLNGVNIAGTFAANTDFVAAVNAVSDASGVTAEVDGGGVRLTAADGRNITIDDVGGNVETATGVGADGGTEVTRATVTLQADEQFTIGGANVAHAGLTASATPTGTAQSVNIDSLDYSTQSGATAAIESLDNAIRMVNERQGDLGAVLNRMDAAVSQLSAASENISSARSQVQDADFAAETAVFSKNQILQQASSAMLAQANASKQIALQLLG